VADDARGIRWGEKLFLQIAVSLIALLIIPLPEEFSVFGLLTVPLALPLGFLVPLFRIVFTCNAVNFADGLDGLASGLAVIAATGMAGSLFFVESPGQIFMYLAFIGSLLGFLRYNFNPASIFLGDTGSMFLGFFLSVMPLATQTGGSFLVGIGVPLLAMGVPIFDAALAIVRRTVRAVLKKEEGGNRGGARLMQPDSDHLHHRLLRRFVSQRKTAVAMYAFAAFLVATGIGGIALKDRAAGLFIIAFVVATFIIVRDMSRVELWDAGRLANMVVHGRTLVRRRRRAAFYVPLLILADVAILSLTWYLTLVVLKIEPAPRAFHTFLPLNIPLKRMIDVGTQQAFHLQSADFFNGPQMLRRKCDIGAPLPGSVDTKHLQAISGDQRINFGIQQRRTVGGMSGNGQYPEPVQQHHTVFRHQNTRSVLCFQIRIS
jgi:UDP-N-acetylmuramyl pentapeptide phosphotransferase/UDP-N-acetylglucosamine-1-phosphate transferase